MKPEIREQIIMRTEKRGVDGREFYEYVDNFRAFNITTGEGHGEYLQKYKQGCCGYMDWLTEDREGNLWLVGFNYGH